MFLLSLKKTFAMLFHKLSEILEVIIHYILRTKIRPKWFLMNHGEQMEPTAKQLGRNFNMSVASEE